MSKINKDTLPTQHQFVRDCMDKYLFTDIPPDQIWEVAHFPLPSCSGEDDTVLLWSADHTVQGLLQSVEFDHLCFYYKANGRDLYNLETYYPQYLKLFAQLKSQFARRRGKKAAELKVGVHAPGMAAAAGKKCAKLKRGVHAPGMASKGGERGGKVGGKIGGKTTGNQKWQCLVTGFISNPGGLSKHQNKRGIDTKLRVKLQ